MKSLRRILTGFLAVFLLGAAALAADETAPPPPDNSTAEDAPGRVARLQYMTGQVSVQPQGAGDWIDGDRNRPLTNGDNVWADKESRAELSLGVARARIDSETSLTMTNIGNNAIQLSLHQGSLNLSVGRIYGGETYEVDTPNIAFTVGKPGDYRFDVDPNGDTTVATVWKGEGDATGSGPAVHVAQGERVTFSGGDSLEHQVAQAGQPDAFDQWCRVRDQHAEHSASARYVNPDVVGSDDLDEYGSWKETPDYGPVWVPTAVYPGWAPYTNGYWGYVGPWGWTWIDAYPWGFAPFHYGRWVYWGGYWGWAPGPYWVRPWYAPGLVAWWGGPGWGVGFGFGFGFGFGGGFGWCPLGWREPFYPWYHASPYYFRNVNITNARITNINNISNTYFHNGQTPLYGRNGFGMPRFSSMNGAVTAMSRNNLERGLPVRGNSVKVSPEQLKGASTIGKIDATPSRNAMLGAHAGQPAARPSGTSFSRATVSRMTPPSRTQSAGSQSARNTESGTRGAESARASQTATARGGQEAASARPESQSRYSSTPGPAGRNVPRPPQSMTNSQASANRGLNEGASSARNVPRPPSASTGQSRGENQMATNRGESSFGNSRTSSSFGSRSVPRPPEGSMNRSNFGSSGGRSSENYGSSRGYSGGYSTRAYGGYPSGSYGSSRFGGFPSGSRSYSAPSHSYGGYGGYHGSSGGYHGSSGGYHGGGGGGSHGGGGGHR